MSEEEKPAVETPEDSKPEEFDRSHPAFKAVTQQLSSERKDKEALTQRLAALEEAEQARSLAKDKAAGDFEKVELEYKSQIDALKMERTQLAEQSQKQQTNNQLQVELAKLGVADSEHIEFLTAKYHNSGDSAEIGEWVKGIHSNDSYAVFFKGQKQVLTPPVGTTSSNTSRGQDWAQMKADLHGSDPSKVKIAAKAFAVYHKENGKMPE